MKTKIGLGIWIIAAIIVSAVFLSDYNGRSGETDVLNAKIHVDSQSLNVLTQNIKSVNTEIQEINANIAKAQTDIESAGDVIPPRENSNNLIRSILSHGQTNQLTIIPLSTEEWTQVDIRNNPYEVFKIALSVEGQQANLLEYIKWLQKSPYPTLSIEDLTITRVMDQVEKDIVRANLKLAIYAK
jgi:septal ring factor EnvC (AmiA/AmiB activator)